MELKNESVVNIDDYVKKGFKILMEATKISNSLPTEREWDFYKLNESFKRTVNFEGDRILCLMNTVLYNQQQNINIRNRDLEEKTELVIEANDDILEKVAFGIDEMNGIKRTPQETVEIHSVSAQLSVNGSWNRLQSTTFNINSSLNKGTNNKDNAIESIRLITAKNIIRPQSFFKDKIDNRNDHPWIPRITEKPNSLKPLAIFLEESDYGETYSHPYIFELDIFKPLPAQLQKTNPVLPKPVEQTPLIEVSTVEQLQELLEELRTHREFAVDVEHHSFRTFMGITCLLQISTKDSDYLIDTFALRDKLCILNEVFTKPTIVKVFHGADHDIEWLQRDLSLYVVNMFDTHQASKQLNYPRLSLAYLLSKYCKIIPNKHFQLADWRIRPLPEELKVYARLDTHYLLYIYHILKNELINLGNGSDNILKSVIHESTQICKKRYIKPTLLEDSYLDFYRKCKRLFDNRQMSALKELYLWRDTIARAEDESTGYVLPNHMLLQIAETLPREMQGILACCKPIPSLVRSNLLEIHRIILRAREQPLVKPILKEDNRSKGSTLKTSKINLNSPLHCPHDLSKSLEFRDDLQTLLSSQNDESMNFSKITKAVINIERTLSKCSIFNTPEISDNEGEEILKVSNITFLAPYQRYELVKPFIQAEEEKAAAENKEKEKSSEDRIADLHAHFVKVTKETPQLSAPNKQENLEVIKLNVPLISMPGSKKRKRSISENNRNDSDLKYDDSQNEVYGPSRPKRCNRNKSKNKNKNITPQKQNQSITESPDSLDDSRGEMNKRKMKPNKCHQTKRNRIELPNNNSDAAQIQQNIFTPFDYSTVNFEQFQGGAGRPTQAGPVRSSFKAKKKKKWLNKNSNNKSMTFNRRNN